jgi:hypothetical protein
MPLRNVSISYDDASQQEGDALFVLSESTRSIILALSGTFYWATRWYKDDETEFTDEQKATIVSLAQRLESEILNPMEFCAQMINCLLNDADTISAFDGFVSERATAISEKILTERIREILEYRVTPTAEVCEDGLFAIIRQTINYADVHTRDFLASVEGSFTNNKIELINAIARIAGASGAGVGILDSWLTYIVDNILDAYPIVSTTELLDAISCEIFCITKEGCDISLGDFVDFFRAKVDAYYPTDASSFFAYIGSIIGLVLGDAPTDFVVYVMLRNFFEAVALADTELGTVFRAGLSSQAIMASFRNDADADWSILCEDCLPPATKTMRAYGRGYQVNGGSVVVVNPSSDAFYTYECNIGDEITLVCNGTAVASGDWEGNALQTITITYLSLAGGSYTQQYENLTGTTLGAWAVGSTITNAQANAFGLSAMAFTVDA